MRRAIATGLVWIASITAGGQTPPAFRGDARLVRLSVVVHGKDGEPVAGLTREDFTLLEDGKPQPIDVFSVEADTAREVSTSSPAAAGNFSNRLDAGARGSVTAVVFDRMNTLLADQRQARSQLQRFLGQIRAEDRVGLYVIDSQGARILHDFTSDSTALIGALSWPATADRPPQDPELAAWLSRTVGAMTASVEGSRVGGSTASLLAIARHLAGVRGRKNLIWVSAGVPMVVQDQTLLSVYSELTHYFDDMNIAVYPVDARGLVGPNVTPASTPPEIAAMKGNVTSKSVLPERGVAAVVPNIEAMRLLAANTGGHAFFDTNDISKAVRTAIDDGRLTYVLGYYPSHGKWDGTFRKLAVKVNRAGVDVRHRSGYMAFPAAPQRRPPQGDELLTEARSPFTATGIGIAAHATLDASSRDVTALIHVDPETLTITQTATQCAVSLALAVVQSAPDGTVAQSTLGDVGVTGPIARCEQLSRQGFSFTRTFPLAAAAERVHIVLRDVASGATGSIIIPVAALGSAQ